MSGPVPGAPEVRGLPGAFAHAAPTQSLLFSVSHSAGQSPLEGEPLCAILAPGRRRPVQPLCQPPARHSCYDFVQLALVKRSTGCWMVSQVQQQTARDNETGEFITRGGGQAGRQQGLASGSTGAVLWGPWAGPDWSIQTTRVGFRSAPGVSSQGRQGKAGQGGRALWLTGLLGRPLRSLHWPVALGLLSAACTCRLRGCRPNEVAAGPLYHAGA